MWIRWGKGKVKVTLGKELGFERVWMKQGPPARSLQTRTTFCPVLPQLEMEGHYGWACNFKNRQVVIHFIF